MPTLVRRRAVDLPDRPLVTADGVRLSARHEPAGPGSPDLAFVVAHGFTGSWRRPDVQAVVSGLRRSGGVVCFDFRGHGGSAGLSTVGDLEIQDLDAAVRWARELGYARVATVGWSMGAAVAIRQAALLRGVDAVVAVSGPSRWHFRSTPAMRLVHLAIETWAGRAVTATFFGTRIVASGWQPPPEPPDALVGRIAPVPLLLVHGDADPFFPLDHARWLARAAGAGAHLWVEPGFGHAENAASPELIARIAAWVHGSARGVAPAVSRPAASGPEVSRSGPAGRGGDVPPGPGTPDPGDRSARMPA
ncbi:MAG TPA: alpha/beta fold hydrolase [Kineosporiaceae bacterium]|nr:alpha/beta fold hydrolase [Kineosporiaceae bacterium]